MSGNEDGINFYRKDVLPNLGVTVKNKKSVGKALITQGPAGEPDLCQLYWRVGCIGKALSAGWGKWSFHSPQQGAGSAGSTSGLPHIDAKTLEQDLGKSSSNYPCNFPTELQQITLSCVFCFFFLRCVLEFSLFLNDLITKPMVRMGKTHPPNDMLKKWLHRDGSGFCTFRFEGHTHVYCLSSECSISNPILQHSNNFSHSDQFSSQFSICIYERVLTPGATQRPYIDLQYLFILCGLYSWLSHLGTSTMMFFPFSTATNR